jgi:hypothetical protein
LDEHSSDLLSEASHSAFYDVLTSTNKLVRGAAWHAGASPSDQRIFDWLDETLIGLG